MQRCINMSKISLKVIYLFINPSFHLSILSVYQSMCSIHLFVYRSMYPSSPPLSLSLSLPLCLSIYLYILMKGLRKHKTKKVFTKNGVIQKLVGSVHGAKPPAMRASKMCGLMYIWWFAKKNEYIYRHCPLMLKKKVDAVNNMWLSLPDISD